MLWTDAVAITPADLARYDSEAATVAVQENITLGGSSSVCQAGYEDAANELMKLVISFGGYLNAGDLSANHLAAVLNVGIGNSVRQKVGLQQVVITGDVATQSTWLRTWATYIVLKQLYRDAFGRTINDRYKLKLDFLKDDMQRRILPNVMALGVPIVTRPLDCPGSFYGLSGVPGSNFPSSFSTAGVWNSNNVTLVAGAGTLTSELDVVVTYCDMSQGNFYVSPSQANNMESNPSTIVTQQMVAGMVLNINIASLNPPTGGQPPQQVLVVVVAPGTATHWNLYVGLTGQTLYLQNSAPIPIATKTYTLPGDPVFSGYQAGIGQYADRRLSLLRTRQRA